MLKSNLLHPEILYALAGAGHSSKVLVADANYPFSTTQAANAEVVYLNLSPGKVNVPEVGEVLNDAIPFESIQVNVSDSGNESEVIAEVRDIVGSDIPISKLKRFEFYEAVNSADLRLIIATGETRIYSCVLITIGYIPG